MLTMVTQEMMETHSEHSDAMSRWILCSYQVLQTSLQMWTSVCCSRRYLQTVLGLGLSVKDNSFTAVE